MGKRNEIEIALFTDLECKHECTYKGYKRAKVKLSKEYWEVKGEELINKTEIHFNACRGKGEIVYSLGVYLNGRLIDKDKFDVDFGGDGLEVKWGIIPFFCKNKFNFKADSKILK